MFLSLGETPLANAFVVPSTSEDEARYPLELVRCETCGLVQLSVVIWPEVLFREYAYSSSASLPLLAYFDDMAAELVDRFGLAGALAVEMGSNDGVLLSALRSRGVRVLGVEPARDQAAVSNARGLDTWNEFFTTEVAIRAAGERGAARLIVATNVLAHVDDLRDLTVGVGALLAADGVFVAEVPYLIDLLDHVEYDTVYHEHLSYFALAPLARLFKDVGLELFDVARTPIHGGSIRIFVARPSAYARTPRFEDLCAFELRSHLDRAATYAEFAERVRASRETLRTMMFGLKSAGKRIVGYGATAKGNTLLNYCDLGTDVLDFVVDATPAKQGLLTPGKRIPIVPEGLLLSGPRPDFALLLAWNYADSIVARNSEFTRTGGRFIHPVPLAKIIA